MTTDFRKPDFSSKDVELRYENGIICIYGTPHGLKKIAEFCKKLIDNTFRRLRYSYERVGTRSNCNFREINRGLRFEGRP